MDLAVSFKSYCRISRFDIWSLFYFYRAVMSGNFWNIHDRVNPMIVMTSCYHKKSVIHFVGQQDFINILLRK